LINEAAAIKMEMFIRDAVTKGATILTGGTRQKEGSLFFTPTSKKIAL
jgi:acyl-CoA reductase-like NAD-dependent aldehyde dehydrogenase